MGYSVWLTTVMSYSCYWNDLMFFWNIFCYGFNREQNRSFIEIGELLERLALDCFNNPFITDTGTPDSNIYLPVGWNAEYQAVNRRWVDFSLPSLMTHRKAVFLTSMSSLLHHQPPILWYNLIWCDILSPYKRSKRMTSFLRVSLYSSEIISILHIRLNAFICWSIVTHSKVTFVIETYHAW